MPAGRCLVGFIRIVLGGAAMYYALTANVQGERQPLSQHLAQVAELCASYLRPLGYESWGYMLGLLHDFGKYSERFQNVLDSKSTHVNHAYPGAAVALGLFYQNKEAARLIACAIAAHHSELDFGRDGILMRLLYGAGFPQDEKGNVFSLFGKEEVEEALSIWKGACPLRAIDGKAPDFKRYEDSGLARELFGRMLFSALIDAEYSTAAEHFDSDYWAKASLPALDVDAAMMRLKNFRASEGMHACEADGQAQEGSVAFDWIQGACGEPGVSGLFKGSGCGNVYDVMSFVLEQCDKRRSLQRVIFVEPSEDAFAEHIPLYRRVFPELLEVHKEVQDGQFPALVQRWDAGCIVTTAEVFWDGLFSNKPGACRHLHRIANSIVVLPEVARGSKCAQVLKMLSQDYGAFIVNSKE